MKEGERERKGGGGGRRKWKKEWKIHLSDCFL
jgi:hypothetical protein